MSEIRKRLQGKHKNFGDSPPGWSDLGLAESDPEKIMSGLGLSRFRGGGEDWLQDIFDLLRSAVKSPPLSGLYSEPVKYAPKNGISIGASSDLMKYSGAVTIRMIKSTLWAAETTGRIAMPSRLKIDAMANGLWISWS